MLTENSEILSCVKKNIRHEMSITRSLGVLMAILLRSGDGHNTRMSYIHAVANICVTLSGIYLSTGCITATGA